MKRIFYYSGYRLTIFHWQNNECITTYSFDPGDEGLDKFKTYLHATENTPVRILVDLIEEDFKKETIPHVNAADRKSIVSRLIDRQYRKSRDYVTYKVVDREKAGRKDDVILYSVLSNPEILEPWLKPMRAAGIAISGIWSLPLLTPKLFNKLAIKANNVLLVSQQVPSNLRQTFIKNGAFESSRSAVVNLEDASIGEYISTEVEQTVRFLSNQRHIGFDEKIEIHVMCRKADIEEIQSKCVDTNLREFHYHDLKELEKDLNCNIPSAEYTNGIYSFVCASQAIPIGDYGNRSTFSNYYEQLTSKALYVSSALLILTAIILSFSFISESIILDEESVTLQRQASVIESNYQKQLAKMEPLLKQAVQMQSSVLLTETIKNNYNQVSPLNFMTYMSQVFSRTGMHGAEILELSWQQNQSGMIPAAADNRGRNATPVSTIDYANKIPINQLATITGFIQPSQTGIKETVYKVNAIAKSFKDDARILDVLIQHMPVDIRPESNINMEAMKEPSTNISTNIEQGKFEIQLLMSGIKS